ncbi:unnamed protein product [Paramecium octaurelia]|uniref:Uncharacterized protein n=1 Tax=Paramecium octaurelia TaxID=43137 RepID=A0A8S1W8Z7_PAROT|nr:unnamed protein product [Paramecium octaurelia]
MLHIFLLFNIISILCAQTCSTTQISCESIKTSDLCHQTRDSNDNHPCEWNTDKCEKSILYNLPCSKYANEYNCFYRSYGCRWDGTNINNYDYQAMLANTDGKCVDQKCEDSTSQSDCTSFGQVSCDWQDGSCVQVTLCKDFQTVKGCRNTRFKEKCVPIVNGDVLPLEQKSTTIFDSFECVVQECKHKSNKYDCTFVNGVQCIWGTKGCSVCAAFTQYETCIENKGLCLWNQNQCQNIECQQYKNPSLCQMKTEQCEWNTLKMRCQLNSTQTNQHCYSEYLDQQNQEQIIEIILIISLIVIG